MNGFLKQIARHYCTGKSDYSQILFVFPSRRAMAFFVKALREIAAAEGGKPFIAPASVSIDDFFWSLSPYDKADRISLIVSLYKSYVSLHKNTSECEGLDDFLFWGDVILNDFSDVDKYCVDAHDLFRNVSELKDMQDDYSDLDPIQVNAIRKFLAHFRSDGENGVVKENFARIWNLLGPLYEQFTSSLKNAGKAYDGMMLRELAESVRKVTSADILHTVYPDCDKVVFCGLNVLSTAEKKILSSLKDARLADFCWDYSSDWIKNSENRSSYFMEDNLRQFGQAFSLESCDRIPRIEVISVPSATGQTKMVSSMLENGYADGDVNTAVILPDEALLLPLLNSLPENVQKVNVTMGCPMSSSTFFCLVRDLLRLQQNIRMKDGRPNFYHKYVRNVMDSNIIAAVADEATRSVFARVRNEGRYYVPSESLAGSQLCELIFRKVVPVADEDVADRKAVMADIRNYLLDILYYIGNAIVSDDGLTKNCTRELDFAMECIKQINLLANGELELMPKTYMRLIERTLSSISVPFKGEPLEGLQIMGPLETRALDFETVFILSSNEGVFPRGSLSPSFVTHSLRQAFGMPTYVFQDAVWAYYFYRLIQRANKLVMIYDSRTEGLKSGEESRYIKQLQYAFGEVDIVKKTAVSSPASVKEPEEIEKTAEDIESIRTMELSASALKSFINCPAQFYYSCVKKLAPEDEVSESMDSGMVGNAFHKSMQKLYFPCLEKKVLSKAFLDKLLADREGIRKVVEDAVRKELNGADIAGRDIITTRMITDYVLNTIGRDKEIMGERAYLELFGLEKKLTCKFHNFNFKGYIDRLDSLKTGTVRVVDYKTGWVMESDHGIDDMKAEQVAEAIFGDGPSKGRPLVAFQFFIYDLLLELSGDRDIQDIVRGKNIANSVYSIREMFSNTPYTDEKNIVFYTLMKERLCTLLDDMTDPSIKFERTQDREYCSLCDFKTICAR